MTTMTDRPTRLTMDADTIERRIGILATHADPSARFCADDATAMLLKHHAGAEWPYGDSDYLPQTWLEAASQWVDRGRAHAYGARIPEAW